MRALLSSNLASSRDPVPEMHEAFFNFIPKGGPSLTERQREDASRNHYLQNRMKLQMKKSQQTQQKLPQMQIAQRAKSLQQP